MGWYIAVFVLGLLLGSLGTYRLAKGKWPWRGIDIEVDL